MASLVFRVPQDLQPDRIVHPEEGCLILGAYRFGIEMEFRPDLLTALIVDLKDFIRLPVVDRVDLVAVKQRVCRIKLHGKAPKPPVLLFHIHPTGVHAVQVDRRPVGSLQAELPFLVAPVVDQGLQHAEEDAVHLRGVFPLADHLQGTGARFQRLPEEFHLPGSKFLRKGIYLRSGESPPAAELPVIPVSRRRQDRLLSL